MELSAKLRQIRKDNNMTQQELADVLCLSRSVIAQYEKGYKVPTITTLDIISNYFKTDIFNEYKNKLKHFFISLKCIYPYLISLLMLLLSSLCLVNNIVKVNNEYGYNIYNDELKVKYSDYIIIAEYGYKSSNKDTFIIIDVIHKKLETHDDKINFECSKTKFISTKLYLIILTQPLNLEKDKYVDNIKYNIDYSPFIYPLKDYNPSLPYDEQEGECRKILNYYIDLIEKIK